MTSDGVPAVDVPVIAVGVDYTGQSSGITTGPDGSACVEVKRGATTNIFLGSVGSAYSTRVTATDMGACGDGPCVPAALHPSAQVCVPGSPSTAPMPPFPHLVGHGLCRAGQQHCDLTGTSVGPCEGRDPARSRGLRRTLR